ncbi:MAG: A24 family peptidase C-terminal domain-containing protein [Candidatus Bathyarchaeia archaeon]
MTFQVIFTAARVSVTAAFLIYASWSDYKTREVSNRVWAIYAPIAIVLSLAELLLYDQSKLALFGISVGFTVGLAFLLFYSGAFGGADSKALMCIAFALPFAPENLFTPILGGGSLSPISQFIFPLTIFSNAVLFAAASCIYMILRNLVWHKKTGKKMFAGTLAHESVWKKVVILITGYKVTVAKLKEKWHVFPMEDVDDDGENALKRKLVVVPHDEGRDKIVERLSNAVQAGKIDAYVWATPGLPMLIFITLGLIVALLFGDMVWLLVRFILG